MTPLPPSNQPYRRQVFAGAYLAVVLTLPLLATAALRVANGFSPWAVLSKCTEIWFATIEPTLLFAILGITLIAKSRLPTGIVIVATIILLLLQLGLSALLIVIRSGIAV